MPLIVYSVREAIKRIYEITGYKYTDQGIRKLINRGRLRRTMIGNLTVITEEDIQEFINVKTGRENQ